MNTVVKFGLVAGALGLAAWGYSAVKKAIADFTFEVVSYGKPSLANWVLTVPIVVRFKNPTPLAIQLDQFIADIFLLKESGWVQAGKIAQPFTIPSGVSDQKIFPAVDLKAVFGGNLIDTITTITKAIQSKTLKVKADVSAIYKGVSIPKQSIPAQDVSLS